MTSHAFRLERTIEFGQLSWLWIIRGIIVLAAIAAGYHIWKLEKSRFNDAKTVEVFSEGLAISNSPQLVLDAHGKILKSNTAANVLFAGGANIEGHNVHDFCLNGDDAHLGIGGLERWYAGAKPDTRLWLQVSARVATGIEDLCILATAVPPRPGSATAVVAIVYPKSQVREFDTRSTVIPQRKIVGTPRKA